MFDDVQEQNSNPISGQDFNSPQQSPIAGQIKSPMAESQPVIPTPPQAGAGKVEDIFAGTDKIKAELPVKPPAFQPKKPDIPVEAPGEDNQGKKAMSFDNIKKVTIIIGALLGIAAIAAGGLYAFNNFLTSKSQPEEMFDVPENGAENENIQEDSGALMEDMVNNEKLLQQPAVETITQPKDSDQDGLSDEEEMAIGTKINSVDSDNDGLFDREEAKVYKTDPLNPDTDGDGYLDGAEVKNRYNPNGPGKLFEIK